MQAKVAELQSTNDSQLAKIHGLERQVGDAEQQAKDRASDLVCCETELAALKDGGAGSTAQARLRLLYHPRIPLFLSLPLALLKGGDAPACAGVAQVNQSCSACAEKDRKMTDIKEKAKKFVVEKVASVHEFEQETAKKRIQEIRDEGLGEKAVAEAEMAEMAAKLAAMEGQIEACICGGRKKMTLEEAQALVARESELEANMEAVE